MLGSGFLEVAIGLAFIYFLISLTCMTVNEIIMTLLRSRGRMLYDRLVMLLGPIVAELYKHPLIAGGSDGQRLTGCWQEFPSYISPQNFVLAMRDLFKKGLDALKAGPSNSEPLKWTSVQMLYDEVSGETSPADKDKVLTSWFQSAMDRLTGSYKRLSMVLSMVVALVICGAGNVDTIAITRTLWHNPTTRAAVVAAATQQSGRTLAADSIVANAKWVVAMDTTLQGLKLPLGWSGANAGQPGSSPLSKVVGILITILMTSLGAPFWFDLLQNLLKVNIAGTSQEPDKPKPDATAS